MIPFYIYYSMFGFQRIGDLAWLAADMRTRGFLCGGTSGRTTLNGEGLQHQDGHSLLLASSIPSIQAYDTAFGYEIVTIIKDGLKRMFKDDEPIYYYLTLGNENYEMPDMPAKAEEGILNGVYKFKSIEKKAMLASVHILASGSLVNEAIKAQDRLINEFNIGSTIWCVTNYKRLREESLDADRTNMLNPTNKKQLSFLQKTLNDKKGTYVAVSDNLKLVSDQIGQWIPNGLKSLGTDGFGRSDTREQLREFFEVDVNMIILASITQLKEHKKLSSAVFNEIYSKLDIKPTKRNPFKT